MAKDKKKGKSKKYNAEAALDPGKQKSKKKDKKKKAPVDGTEDCPHNFLELENNEIFANMITQAKEDGDLFFTTHIGIVKLAKSKTGIRWMLDDNRIAKSVLMSTLNPQKQAKPPKNKKDKKKQQKGIEADAKQQLLLTQAQLSKKYKSQLFSDALEFCQYGKKKFRKKVAESLEGKKKMIGNDLLKIVTEHYGQVPTHDLFGFFEFMDQNK